MKDFFIDTHAHLGDERLQHQIGNVIERALNNNVKKIITLGVDLNSSTYCTYLADRFEYLYASVGVHPSEASNYTLEIESKLEELCINNKVVAIGEISLDYHYEGYNKQQQIYVFERQLLLSYKTGLPIQIHTRDAMKDTLIVLNKFKDKLSNGGIFHCFSGDYADLKRVLDLGFSVSVGGIVTYSNATVLNDIIRVLPHDRLVLETDCPYLCPHPLRGKVNEPANIVFIAEKVASIWGVSLEYVRDKTTQNCIRIFKKLVNK